MTDKDLGEIFDNLFGKDERTDDQREADKQQDIKRRNDANQNAFETERDRRADYLAMDQRIRNIASQETSKLIITGVVIFAAYRSAEEYGWLASVAVITVAAGIWWWNDKQSEKLPKFKIDNVDDLAEDTVTHERIVELAEASKDWITVKGEYLHWDEMFVHPFWERVREKVHLYLGMPHARRVEDNAAARAKSLPFREAMNAQLKSTSEDWELPYWARTKGQ